MIIILEARWELRQQGTELPRVSHGLKALLELVNVLLGYHSRLTSSLFIHLRVGELLPELNGKQKIFWDSFDPVIDIAGVGWPVERAVYLDRIEELAVVLELVYLAGRIEVTSPGTFTSGVGPA